MHNTLITPINDKSLSYVTPSLCLYHPSGMQSAGYHGYDSEQEIARTIVIVLIPGAGEEEHLNLATCCFRVLFWQQRHLRPRTPEDVSG